MIELLAWAVVVAFVLSLVVPPYRERDLLSVFNAQSGPELWTRLRTHRRWLIFGAVSTVLEVAAFALALAVLLS